MWQDELVEMRRERELELLRRSHEKWLMRWEESATHIVVMQMETQWSLLLKEAFTFVDRD